MWIVFSLLAAISAACAIVLSKAGLKKVDPSLAFAVQAIMILSISWGLVFFQKKSPDLSRIDQSSWLYLISAGVITCLSSLFQFNALKLGDAALVSSIERLSLVFAIVLSVIFLKEQLNWKVIVGAILMICGALMITLSRSSGSNQ
jgi:transporter family protein